MKASDIVAQMLSVLPRKTNLFSDQIAISSMTYAAGVVTANTSAPHGLQNGYATVTGALSKTGISSITRSGSIVTVVTSSDHDLTYNWQETLTAKIIGSDQPEYNGEHEILSVPNRRTFTFSVAGTPTTPATGAMFLLEDRIDSFNGRHQITVVSPTSFTYAATSVLTASAGGTPIVHGKVRASGAVTVERALDAYTEQPQGKLWAFVILGDTTVSRDRAILNDADICLTGTEAIRIREIESFMIAVIIPSTNSIAARSERDYVDDVAVAFYRTLVGLKIPSAFSQTRETIITPLGNRFFGYYKGYYVHLFDFQTTQDIIADDMVGPAETRAFRDAVIQFKNEFNVTIADTNVNMDEVPL